MLRNRSSSDRVALSLAVAMAVPALACGASSVDEGSDAGPADAAVDGGVDSGPGPRDGGEGDAAPDAGEAHWCYDLDIRCPPQYEFCCYYKTDGAGWCSRDSSEGVICPENPLALQGYSTSCWGHPGACNAEFPYCCREYFSEEEMCTDHEATGWECERQ